MGIRFDFLRRADTGSFTRPDNFDRNLIVIGGGSAGLVTSYLAAAMKAKVTLVEAHRMGGDCLYTGCVPSKSLLRTAKFLHDVKRSEALGVHTASAAFDFADVMARVRRIIARIEPHDSPERYEGLGVECIQGTARIESPWCVSIDDRRLTTRAIVIATGGRPFVPPVDGLVEDDYVTSETLWDLETQPERFVVLGGGPIGCEMAQAFARLGSRVTLVEMEDRLLLMEDTEVSARVRQALEADGVQVLTGHRAEAVVPGDAGRALRCTANGAEVALDFDKILVAVGRRANTQGLGLDTLGIETERSGTIPVDEHLHTGVGAVYACGDVIGPYQFTHSAAHEAFYCAVNALFGDLYRMPVDYSALPWTTFVDPEVAHLGLNEQQARAEGIPYDVTVHDLDGLDRALAEEEGGGFVKILTQPGKDRILGVTIVAAHAGDLMAEFVLAKNAGLGLGKILGTIHSYPTLAEANKLAAGTWRRARQPKLALKFLERWHRWRR
ncbi:MAG: FAD-dependent oxidoreductase [Xanthomonadales bacterium]|nr:FAD-dependent oxidoreductase [Xanthomonadales bacterium]